MLRRSVYSELSGLRAVAGQTVCSGSEYLLHSLLPITQVQEINITDRSIIAGVTLAQESGTSAPINRLISRESSASPNLIGDRAAHPVCDHYISYRRHAAAVWIQLALHLSDSQLAAVE